MASIYDINYAARFSDLLPPSKRLPKWLGFMACFAAPLQWNRDLVFGDYAIGSTASNWVTATPYPYQQRVIDVDGGVYELQSLTGLTSATPPHQDPANWIKVLNTFLGVRQRARTLSKLSMETLLNVTFQVASFSWQQWSGAFPPYTQIYIVNTPPQNTAFWLSNGAPGSLTTFLGNSGSNSSAYLGNTYATGVSSFIVKVPVAVYAAIGANLPPSIPTAEDKIRSILDPYVQAGKLYTIIQY
jgi:hypothetical protein